MPTHLVMRAASMHSTRARHTGRKGCRPASFFFATNPLSSPNEHSALLRARVSKPRDERRESEGARVSKLGDERMRRE
eukprot:1600345-Rhodomonas_salina.1